MFNLVRMNAVARYSIMMLSLQVNFGMSLFWFARLQHCTVPEFVSIAVSFIGKFASIFDLPRLMWRGVRLSWIQLFNISSGAAYVEKCAGRRRGRGQDRGMMDTLGAQRTPEAADEFYCCRDVVWALGRHVGFRHGRHCGIEV